MARVFSYNPFISSYVVPNKDKNKSTWTIAAEGNIIPKDVIDYLMDESNNTPQPMFFREMVSRGKYVISETSTDSKEIDSSKARNNVQRVALEIQNMSVKEARKMIVGDKNNSEDHGLLDITVLKALKEADSRTGIQNAVEKQIQILFERDEEDE